MRSQIRTLAKPFSEHDWPGLTCPTCRDGVLGAPSIVYENDARDPATDAKFDNDPTAPEGGFHGHLVCSRQRCGAWAVIGGRYTTDWQMFPGNILDLWAVLEVKTILPGPSILELSPGVPEPVRREIDRASNLIWLDPQAAAGALRSAVERVMDDHDIPAEDSNGGYLTLHNRLQKFKQKNQQTATLLMAVKWVGNGGVHQSAAMSADDALDTAEIVEVALGALYAPDDSAIRERAERINTAKRLVP